MAHKKSTLDHTNSTLDHKNSTLDQLLESLFIPGTMNLIPLEESL